MDAEAQALLVDLNRLIPVIARSPNSAEQFIEKMRTVVEAQGKMETFKVQMHKAQDMAKLMETNAWAVPDEQEANLRVIEENVTSLESAVQEAEGREEEDAKRFAQEIEDEIPKLAKKINRVREQLDDVRIASTEVPAESVLSFLARQREELDAHKARTEKLTDFQNALNLDPEDWETLDEVQADLNLKTTFWTAVRDWSVLTARWTDTPLGDVDATELEKEVTRYNKVCTKATKGLPLNPKVPELKAKVEEFSPVLPVVRDLRNESMKDRHWEQIHSLIGFEVKGDESFTLGDLVKRHVTDFHEEITTIATSAQQEAVLEGMMDKVEGIWREAIFEVKSYKESKDMFMLGDTSEVSANLDDCLVTISTILGSRYVAGIREYVEGWRKS